VRFLAEHGKPYCLCLPAYAHERAVFSSTLTGSLAPLYLVPPSRYFYWAPGGTRGKPTAVAPFDSIWYVSDGSKDRAAVARDMVRDLRAGGSACKLICDVQELAGRAPQSIKGGKRQNPKQRKAAAKKLRAAE
jgi:hypothetical protein